MYYQFISVLAVLSGIMVLYHGSKLLLTIMNSQVDAKLYQLEDRLMKQLSDTKQEED